MSSEPRGQLAGEVNASGPVRGRDRETSPDSSDGVAPRPEQTAVIVMGMHRSGTSLLSRLLNLVGVDLGRSGDVEYSREDNPRGFWEHALLSRTNDAVLAAFGGSWDEPPRLPSDWLGDRRLDPLRERAREIIEEDFAGSPLWGFKDPRTSLVAPFWHSILRARTLHVVAVRNPLEVADSLARRDGLTTARSVQLWYVYTRSALAASATGPRAVVHYDRLLADPSGEIARITRTIDLPAAPADLETLDRIRREAIPDLRHHLSTLDDFDRDPAVSEEARELYRQLTDGSDAPSR